MSLDKPKVIAFEGVDGAGKSTVLELVVEELRARGRKLCLPRVGKEHKSKPIRGIRRLTRDRTNLELCPRSELLLYAAREAQVLEQYVRPALARGETVLLDRSMLTPVVLGSFGRGLELDACERVADAAAAGIGPDLTLIFDVDPRTSRLRKRIAKLRAELQRDGGRKGLAGSEFKVRIRDGYQAIAARDRLPVIYAERSRPKEVAARVLAHIEGQPGPEPEADRRPWWEVDPELDFDEAIASLPPLMQLYFSRRLVSGRAVRAELFEREPALAVWAADLEDPVLERARASVPERVLDRLSATPEAAPLRAQLAESHPAEVARSLVNVAGPDADELRARLIERAPGSVFESLAGRSDGFALDLRERTWKAADSYERALGLRGCEDADAWRRRDKQLERDPAVLIPTLVGLAPERVDPILERHAELAPKAVLRALSGRSDARAHGLRRDLVETGREVVDSVSGLSDKESWDLRERFAERWPSTVAWSVREPVSDPRARALIERCRRAAPGDLFLKRRLVQLDAAVKLSSQ